MKKEFKTMLKTGEYTIKGYREKNDLYGNPLYRIQIFNSKGKNVTSQAKGINGRYYKKGDFITFQSYNVNGSLKHFIEVLEEKNGMNKTKYNFYVISNNVEEFKKFDNIHKAIEYFDTITYDDYKALGVEKIGKDIPFGIASVDLLINSPENEKKFWISQDCKKMQEFKNDKLITLNCINIIKENYAVEEK